MKLCCLDSNPDQYEVFVLDSYTVLFEGDGFGLDLANPNVNGSHFLFKDIELRAQVEPR